MNRGLVLRVPPGPRIGALVWLTVGAGMFTSADEHSVTHTLDGARMRGEREFWRNTTMRRQVVGITVPLCVSDLGGPDIWRTTAARSQKK